MNRKLNLERPTTVFNYIQTADGYSTGDHQIGTIADSPNNALTNWLLLTEYDASEQPVNDESH